MNENILLVEDEAIFSMVLRSNLEKLGYKISDTVSTGEDAVESALKNRPKCILMDINLIGEINGIEAADKIVKDYNTNIIFITGYSTGEVKTRALKSKPLAYLEKPINLVELDSILKKVIAV